MIEVLHASVIVLAITHVATLGLLAVDLRRARPLGTLAAVGLGAGTAGLGTAVASMYVPCGRRPRPAPFASRSSSVTWPYAATSCGQQEWRPGRASP